MFKAIVFVLFVVSLVGIMFITAPAIAILGVVALIGLYSSNRYLTRVFLVFDQGVNVVFSGFFNWLFESPTYRFGDEDETISSVIGKNLSTYNKPSTQNAFKYLDKWLTAIDPSVRKSHSLSSIEHDENVN